MAAFDTILAALLLATALFVVAVREARPAIAGFITLGFLLALVWLRLGSVDVALTEAAIGGGATGVLLLRASARLDGRDRDGDNRDGADRTGNDRNGAGLLPSGPGALAAAIAAGLLALAVLAVLVTLPTPAPGMAEAVMARLPELGLVNPVTGVLLGFRALDTLLEKIVLLVGLLGIWSLAPDGIWTGSPARMDRGLPGGPLDLTARVLPPFGLVIGTWLVWAGADDPGGTFQGGAVLAAMWLLPMMAGLVPPPQLGARRLRLVLFAGPALFIAVGLGGYAVAEGFLSYPPGFAKPLIIAIEVALTASIAAVVGLMILGPATGSDR